MITKDHPAGTRITHFAMRKKGPEIEAKRTAYDTAPGDSIFVTNVPKA